MTIKIVIAAALVALVAGCASAPAPQVDDQAGVERQHMPFGNEGGIGGGFGGGFEGGGLEDQGPATTEGKVR